MMTVIVHVLMMLLMMVVMSIMTVMILDHLLIIAAMVMIIIEIDIMTNNLHQELEKDIFLGVSYIYIMTHKMISTNFNII